MNNSGKGSALFLLVLLCVALLIAYLAISNMSSLGFGKQSTQQENMQNPVDQAEDVVNQLNERTQQSGQKP